MKALLAFFLAALFVVPTLAKRPPAAPCVEVEENSSHMVELMTKKYVAHDSRIDVRSTESVSAGIGINPSLDVVLVVPNSSAEKEGIPLGATIIAVDGASTGNLSFAQVIQLIRGNGEEHSVVHVRLRLTNGSTRGYTLNREKIVGAEFVTMVCMAPPISVKK